MNIIRYIKGYLLRYYLFYLLHFNRGKLKENLFLRKDKGKPKCTDCGKCCSNCIVWNRNTKLCKIVKNRDYLCREYPIAPIQLKLTNLEGICRFYWEK